MATVGFLLAAIIGCLIGNIVGLLVII